MLKYAGIWIDGKTAVLAILNTQGEKLVAVITATPVGKVKGGAGTSTPYQQQNAVSESKMREKKSLQQKNYFLKVINELMDVEEFLIMGPGNIKSKFRQFLLSRPNFKHKMVMLETQDKMTQNQIVARTKEFFKSTDAI